MNKKLIIVVTMVSTVFCLTAVSQLHAAFDMVFVKSGCFDMGDTFGDGDVNEKPAHRVCVDDFYIGKCEVTQKEWMNVMGNNPSFFKNCENCPVEAISFEDVRAFITTLHKQTGRKFRLPTEAEWEYAARSGGKKEKWSGTSNESDVMNYVWYEINSVKRETHPVGTKSPNGLGIYDMSGNVSEWVNDWYVTDYYKNSHRDNPKGPSKDLSGDRRVVRGGGWSNDLRSVRTYSRGGLSTSMISESVGFRLVEEK